MLGINPFKLRTIRSFVRRDGHLSRNKKMALENLSQDQSYSLELNGAIFDFTQIFQNTAPIVLEIGFGMGQSLLQQAEQNPDKNFIGVEVHRPGIAAALLAAQKKNLTNLRIINSDAIEVLNKYISNTSLDIIQIFFPDPWPKRRHHKRRLIQPNFIELVQQKLKPNGKIHLATDWEDYANQMLDVLSKNKNLKNYFGENQFALNSDRPNTKFELRGKQLGHGIWDLVFTKILEQGN